MIEPPVTLYWTVSTAAEMLGLVEDTVHDKLQKHAALFDEPLYRRVGRHPRLHRVLSEREIKLLQALMSYRTRSQREARARAAARVSRAFRGDSDMRHSR